MRYKKNPPSAGTEERGTSLGDRVDHVVPTKLLERYARHKGWNCQIGAVLGDLCRESESNRLMRCGRFLAFRHYLETGKLKLVCGYYCNAHLLCPCCAAARSRRMIASWLPRVFTDRPAAHYMLTLTWPPPPVPLAVAAGPGGEIYKLRRNLAVGTKAWGKLWMRRKKRLTGPLKRVLGAILSVEVTRGPSGEWHPHFHILLSTPPGYHNRVDAGQLREDWTKLTGGRQIDIKFMRRETDIVEVLKYAVKPADLAENGMVSVDAIEDRVMIFDALRGRRLLRGYGLYFGAEDPDLTQPEDLDDTGEWIDLVFEWIGGKYKLVKEVPGV